MGQISSAVISDNHDCNIMRFPDDWSNFNAEAKAVDLALDFIRKCDNKLYFLTCFLILKVMTHTSSKNQTFEKKNVTSF